MQWQFGERQRGIEQAAWRRAVAWVSSPGIIVMGLGRGSTITSEWKGSNPVTPSQIRCREKDLDKEERERDKEAERDGGRDSASEKRIAEVQSN